MFVKMLPSYAGLTYFGRLFPLKQLLRSSVKKFSSDKSAAVILGIESSCDDTGCAIVNTDGVILGEALHSQRSVHLDNGGIIPPLAGELHRQCITKVVEEALVSAGLKLKNIDAIASTVKPGLPMSLRIGTEFGKYLSRIGNLPFIPIHHMEAHALTIRMTEKVDFPFLVLLISGGHCLIALAESIDHFLLLGSSMDDAPGEAFDKIARRLKLRNIPEFANLSGGAALEKAASKGTDPNRFQFMIPMTRLQDCNFSVSGIKTAAIQHTKRQERLHEIEGDQLIPDLYDFCAGVQLVLTRHLCHRTQRAMEFIDRKNLIPEGNRTLVVSGGVACNNYIAQALETVSSEMGYKFLRPVPKLCTDNGIMIAWNGVERWKANCGVLRDQKEIEKVDIDSKALFGEDWSEKVSNERISCKWVKIPDPRIRKR
ncbi:tRNA N6-adenosine threonylcarbamoyltransferase, mitochondrial [Athalia rosae]|uniref:tRNA N6-adenosine threonylcarbamoyltransferase, mitochondrial n=1 Tax=Athalia rosae TaxID=37344 RepID=UPI00203408AF|nr:tRNA N6-adenosine threonylcarbamoyltransferase, mitochondrial [Athalia rosae]